MAHLFSYDPQAITRAEAIEQAQTAGLTDVVAFSNGVLLARGALPATHVRGLTFQESA